MRTKNFLSFLFLFSPSFSFHVQPCLFVFSCTCSSQPALGLIQLCFRLVSFLFLVRSFLLSSLPASHGAPIGFGLFSFSFSFFSLPLFSRSEPCQLSPIYQCSSPIFVLSGPIFFSSSPIYSFSCTLCCLEFLCVTFLRH